MNSHPIVSLLQWPAEARLLRWLTFLWVVGGLVILFSASFPVAQQSMGDGLYFVKRQLIWVFLGYGCFSLIVRFPVRHWFRLSGWLCLLSIGLVMATHVPGLGVNNLGASRWLDLKVLPVIQPSEFLKPFLILQGSLVFGRWYQHRILYRLGWMAVFLLALLAVLAQPSLGTTAICGLTLWLMAWTAGLPAITLLGSAGAGVLTALLSIATRSYQLRRVLAFLDPWSDPLGDGYQLVQSLIAIGSGGTWGVGFGLSQQKLFYLPIQYTDFIFSVFAEEFGLLGSGLFLLFLLTYTLIGLRVMLLCQDLTLRLIACGCLCFLVGQSILNLGVVSGVLPTTGLPLPLVSHGGSSMLAAIVIAGLLVRVAREVR